MKSILFFVFAALCLSACRNEPVRREYQEVVIRPAGVRTDLPAGHPQIGGDMGDPSMRAMIQDSVSDASIAWTTPEEWTQLPGDGMRVATLKSPDSAVEMILTSFGGQVGGVEANVVRWLNQLKVNLDEKALKDFVSSAQILESSGGLRVSIFDFTAIASGNVSTIAAIVEIPDSTVFVKMNGRVEDLKAYKNVLLKFCDSLRIVQ